MKIALIHDFLFEYGGSERVVAQILNVYPQADLFTLFDFVPPATRGFLHGKTVHTSFLQKLPLLRRDPARYLPYTVPLMPFAIERFDLSAYDLVLSSSHSVAKGVLTGPDQLHVAYIHSPMRYAWDQQRDYTGSAALSSGLKRSLGLSLLTWMRVWDIRTANGVDQFIANSQFIARRIQKTYRREAAVIYPPVEVEAFPPRERKEDYYLVVSRLVPYKRVDLIVKAFRAMPDRKLVLIGSGPEEGRIRQLAGSNVRFLGYLSSDELAEWMGGARALIQAAQEDFGITTVEAQAGGTPVIAYRRGGASEIVRGLEDPHPTGIFFDEQTPESLIRAVDEMERSWKQLSPGDCHRNALRFDARRFRDEFQSLVAGSWALFHGGITAPQIPVHLDAEAPRGRQ